MAPNEVHVVETEPLMEPYDEHLAATLRTECYRRGLRPTKKGPLANYNKDGFIELLRRYDSTKELYQELGVTGGPVKH